MSCLFRHRWIYDFRLHHVYRKCQFCDVVQHHVRNKKSAYTAWEPISERSYIESEQRQIVQHSSPGLVRLTRLLWLMRTRTSDRSLREQT